MIAPLRISSVVIKGEQSLLFPGIDDFAVQNQAHARQIIGDAAETLLSAVTGADRHQTDAHADICPDLSLAGARYLECKAIREKGELILFEHRLENDLKLLEQTGGDLTYAMVIHSAKLQAGSTRDSLRRDFINSVAGILFIPLNLVAQHCRRRSPVMLAYRPGGSVSPCWRIPWGCLQRMAGKKSITLNADMVIFNQSISYLRIAGPALSSAFPALSRNERQAAQWMLTEFENTGLDVVLAPAPEKKHTGHCIRIVQQQNPAWYRGLCEAYPTHRSRPRNKRQPDTSIKRKHVRRALIDLAGGSPPSATYHFRLIPLIRAYLAASNEAFAHPHYQEQNS